LKDFHASLARQTFTDFTVYFVDNNSTDGSSEYFRQLNVNKALDAEFIELNYNSGFSGGCNIGAEKAISRGCRYLFLSNNDLVLDTHALEELFKLAESDPAIACTGPLVFYHSVNNPGTIQEFGGKINFRRVR
jgi:GT2 family glycosyltransferase